MKKLALATAIIAAVIMTGCSDNPSSPVDDEGVPCEGAFCGHTPQHADSVYTTCSRSPSGTTCMVHHVSTER